ncbi:hypothetical protein ASE37_15035 [Rhizobium sp. Root268]|nr:hypothetical protein ASC86_15045 [Rhizobium sp. Root1212]KRD23639.1 hypothetical protein ASE37_15035 [Rhizobium sp. Root268]
MRRRRPGMICSPVCPTASTKDQDAAAGKTMLRKCLFARSPLPEKAGIDFAQVFVTLQGRGLAAFAAARMGFVILLKY